MSGKEAPFLFSQVFEPMEGTDLAGFGAICKMAEETSPEAAMQLLEYFMADMAQNMSGNIPEQAARKVSWFRFVEWAGLVELYILIKWEKYSEAKQKAKELQSNIDFTLRPFLADLICEIPFG
jgi:hypothetical protein